MIIVLGNGKSRLNFDLDELSEHAITFGCNALYRDFAPDILLTVDIPITLEILSTEYTKRNKLEFLKIKRIYKYYGKKNK